MFGDSYQKVKHLLDIGLFVFVTGKIGPKKWGDGLEFHLSSMKLLAEVKEKKTKALVLSIEQSDITDDLLDDLYNIFEENIGNCQVKFELKDHKTNTVIKMPSKTIKIEINKHLINYLNQNKVFEYKLE